MGEANHRLFFEWWSKRALPGMNDLLQFLALSATTTYHRAMRSFFAIIVMAVVGTLGGGVAGLLLTMPIATILTADSVEGAIWIALGGLAGAAIGFFGGIILSLHYQGIGGELNEI